MNRPLQKVRQFKGCPLASLLLLLSIFLATVAYGNTGDKDLISVNERAWLSQNQSRLVLAVETGYAPFAFLDVKSRPTGLAHDYMRLIEAKLGVQFNQKRFSSLDEIFKAVRSGEVHIVNAVTSTPERLKFLSMTDSYISVPNVIIVSKNHPGTVSEKVLSGLKVSVVKSYAVTQYMTNHDLHFIPDIVADDLTAILNVSFGRSDAAVIDLATASYLISEKGIANLRVDGVVAYDNKLSLASPQNEPVLHGILQKGLNAITDAERQAIKQRWINLSEEQNILYDLTGWNTLGLVLAVAFLVIAIIVTKNRPFRLLIIPPLLVLVGGLALTYIVQQSALSIAYKAHQDVFNHQAREILLRIDQRLIAYKQILRGAKGLFYASKSVARNEFHDYIGSQRLLENFPGIQGVGFSLVVTPNEKARHIEAVRKEGFPNYLVRPEGERDLYTSIIYLEPFEGRNLRAFGFDMYSESVRRQAMEQARDEDKATLSGKVLLVQETATDVQAGVLMYVPVYHNGKPHATLAERRANILGWTYSPFRMNDLMQGLLGDQANRMDIEIYDGDSATPETLLYDSNSDLAPDQESPYQFTQNVELSGRHWMIKMHALPHFEAQLNTERVTAIRLIGIALSVVMSILIWQLTSGRSRALKLAKVMTQELSKAQSLAKLGNWQVIFGKDESQDKWTVSDELRKVWGLSDTQGINTQGGFATMPPEDRELTRQYWAEAKQGKGPTEWEHRILVNGEIKWLNVMTHFTFDPEGKPLKARGTIQDITERKQMEEQVRQLAFYDTLTKLPNRRLLSDRLDQAMSASKRNGLYSALMFLDLDNFKPLNDTHGHVVGDLLLIEAASRLKGSVRGMDTVARFGGDEFVVILSELEVDKSKSTAQAKLVAEKILASLSDPYLLTLKHDGQAEIVVEHRCTASIGVALFVNHEGSQDDIMGWADAAMYLAKEGGRNQIRFYDAKD